VFNLTDAQLFVARRDNARAIFSGHLAARGGEFPAERCAGLNSSCLALRHITAILHTCYNIRGAQERLQQLAC
jgi:hypothetical protein